MGKVSGRSRIWQRGVRKPQNDGPLRGQPERQRRDGHEHQLRDRVLGNYMGKPLQNLGKVKAACALCWHLRTCLKDIPYWLLGPFFR